MAHLKKTLIMIVWIDSCIDARIFDFLEGLCSTFMVIEKEADVFNSFRLITQADLLCIRKGMLREDVVINIQKEHGNVLLFDDQESPQALRARIQEELKRIKNKTN